ncbi:MAG: cyclic nucleotide-binding domain-containing protein [Deltaproteobacteria bacterium]|nr:cyclic nucleotide-binding domain-containing protein [Deltaproteobacteria bacterium]
MSEKIRKLKEDASRLIAKGKLAEACECYEKIVKTDNRDLTARQKLAELYARLGKKEEAVHSYQSVAGSYAADGLLLKAIAVCKIILQLDPTHTETQNILAELSTKRRGGDQPSGENVVEMPKAMSAALSQGGAAAKKSANQIRGVSANHIRGVPPSERIQQGSITNMNVPPAAGDMVIERGTGSATVSTGPALGQSPQTSAEELKRAAAAMLGAQRPNVIIPPAPPAQPSALVVTPLSKMQMPPPAVIPDDLPIDISFDDAEPIVVGNSLSDAPKSVGAPILTAAIAAATPSFDELMEMTSSVGVLEDPGVRAGAAIAPPPSLGVMDLREPAASMPLLRPTSMTGSGRFELPPGLEESFADVDGTGMPEQQPNDAADMAADGVADGAEFIDDDDDGDSADVLELSEVSGRVDVDNVPPIPLFSDLPRDAFVALTERMELRIATVDDALIQEGEAGTSMFIIIQGKVKVVRTDDGVETLLAELSDGAFFGEMALLSDAPRTASVIATEETMLFEISRDMLAAMTTEHPSVGEVMKKFHKNRLITNLLKTSPIFQPFSTTDKKLLIEKFKSRQVTEGTYLITREKPGDGLYVVLSGRCEVLDKNADDKDVVIAELKEGDVFGEMSMLWNKDTCASVRAQTTCVVLRLPRQNFGEVIMTHPQILETLAALSEKRMKANEELKAAGIASDFLV